MASYSVDGAMAEALGHLNRISSHVRPAQQNQQQRRNWLTGSTQFRKHGQHKSANEMGKLSIMIVNAFSEGLEQIPSSEFALEDMVGHPLHWSMFIKY